MEILSVQNLMFRYPGQSVPALQEVSLFVKAGEFVVVCGPSGCGKSTLLRHFKTALAPCGQRTGTVTFHATPLEQVGQREQSAQIGFVGQSPENQIVTDQVWHELAFGAENLGLDSDTIRRRIAEISSYFNIREWIGKQTCELSGGQKQLLNLAGVLIADPQVLVLDEPTAQLDPVAACSFLQTLHRINRELGVTVLIAEHRLEELFPLCDRVVVLDHGKVVLDAPPQHWDRLTGQQLQPVFRYLPTPMRVWFSVPDGQEEPCPFTVGQGHRWLEHFVSKSGHVPEEQLVDLHRREEDFPGRQKMEKTFLEKDHPTKDPIFSLQEVWFRYEQGGADVLRNLSLKIPRSGLFVLMGENGSGKSTLLSLLAGLEKPYRGTIRINGKSLSKSHPGSSERVCILPQDPLALFAHKTVQDELKSVSEDLSQSVSGQSALLFEWVVQLCELDALMQMHPADLSGGERQRVALTKLLLYRPSVLLLDEPTKGMDAGFKCRFAQILRHLCRQGITVVMVSHDVEFCAEYADRCAMLFDGQIVSEAPARIFFAQNRFYTTAANRMARGILPAAVTVRDIVKACGGTMDSDPVLPDFPQIAVKEDLSEPAKRTMRKKIPVLRGLCFLVALLLTGVFLFDLLGVVTVPFPWTLIQYKPFVLTALPTVFYILAFLRKKKICGNTPAAVCTDTSSSQSKTDPKVSAMKSEVKLQTTAHAFPDKKRKQVNTDGSLEDLEQKTDFSSPQLLDTEKPLTSSAMSTLSKPASAKKMRQRKWLTAAIFVILIPATILAGLFFLRSEDYLILSFAVLVECMIPFFILFEGRKPHARELVLIAVLCALGVAGRMAFAFIPQFKPVLALTVVCGAMLGGESGFLVGALTMLLSNILFQQGPWTPWQMFAMGLVGFVAGLLFFGKEKRKKRGFLCLYGFVSALILYGVLMNFASAMLVRAYTSLPVFLSYFVAGFPMDIVHATASVLFLFFGSDPLMNQLQRIRQKYKLFY